MVAYSTIGIRFDSLSEHVQRTYIDSSSSLHTIMLGFTLLFCIPKTYSLTVEPADSARVRDV